MAAVAASLALLQLFFIFFVLASSGAVSSSGCYTAIFSFGDSLADTGNLLISQKNSHVGHPPYGETYFHRPTGRFSDGRLVVDFIAQALGLPLLPPYLAGPDGHGFRQGVNFAVAGATALDHSFFIKNGVAVTWTNFSLGVQLDWFRQLLPSVCHSPVECHQMMKNSLFLVGEIGGNDYNHPFTQGVPMAKIRTFVHPVVDAIGSAIKVLIELGATKLVVPGNFPIGCNAAMLTSFKSSRKEDYNNKTGCISWLNKFAKYHNLVLQEKLQSLRKLYPHTNIIYADYYDAAMSMFYSPHRLGFIKVPLKACCGGGGSYNFRATLQCGNKDATVCADPDKFICWDGVHFTEAAYSHISDGILKGPFANPPILNICS